MKRILEYLKETRNSFDHLLFEYDNSKLLYSYPVLAINCDTLFNISPMLNEIADGFYLRNDKIEPAQYPEFMKNQIPDLILQSANRYYNTYKDDKQYQTFYTIYTKESCNMIYDFFDECGEGVESVSPFCYKRWLRNNELPSHLIEEMKSCVGKKVVEKKDIVGMVSITSTDILDGSTGAVFALLLNRYIPTGKFVEKFNIYERDPEKLYLNSSYLKSFKTKVLAWAFVHDLKKNSPFANSKIMNDEMKAESFITYIRENYGNFTDTQKNVTIQRINQSS